MKAQLRALLPLSLAGSLVLMPTPVRAQLDTAGGGTVITAEGSTIKITINIDVPLLAPGEELSEQVRSYVEPGFAAAADFWNGALAEGLADECFTVEIAVAVEMVDFGESSAGGGHDVHVLHDVNPHFDSPQLTTETPNDDTAQVFVANGTGYFPPWLFQVEPNALAHELGHMFGLGDDYIRNADGNPVTLPGRDGTLMDGGDSVDQELVNRVVDQIRRSGADVPDCRWEGSGLVSQTPLKDDARELTRSADFAFWFDLHKDGSVTGAITLTYAAKLTVAHLPEAEVGIAGFNPTVGGQVTDPNPARTFPLEGSLDDDGLTLRIATPEEDRRQIEFTMRADPGVSAGLGAGGTLRIVPGGAGQVQVIQIEMMPFTPFVGPAAVEEGPDGPYAATFHEAGDGYVNDWTARRVGKDGAEPVG